MVSSTGSPGGGLFERDVDHDSPAVSNRLTSWCVRVSRDEDVDIAVFADLCRIGIPIGKTVGFVGAE